MHRLADRLLDDSAELAGTLPTSEAEKMSLEQGLQQALEAYLDGETAAQRAAAQYGGCGGLGWGCGDVCGCGWVYVHVGGVYLHNMVGEGVWERVCGVYPFHMLFLNTPHPHHCPPSINPQPHPHTEAQPHPTHEPEEQSTRVVRRVVIMGDDSDDDLPVRSKLSNNGSLQGALSLDLGGPADSNATAAAAGAVEGMGGGGPGDSMDIKEEKQGDAAAEKHHADANATTNGAATTNGGGAAAGESTHAGGDARAAAAAAEGVTNGTTATGGAIVTAAAAAAAGAPVTGVRRTLGELESRLLQWQWANAEYGNSACLDKVCMGSGVCVWRVGWRRVGCVERGYMCLVMSIVLCLLYEMYMYIHCIQLFCTEQRQHPPTTTHTHTHTHTH